MSAEINLPEDYNFGYDPTQTEQGEFGIIPADLNLPSRFILNPNYLPPVGSQGQCPSCASWAGVYGLVTYTAASINQNNPSLPVNQASPSYIYIQVMQSVQEPSNQCKGSFLGTYYSMISTNGGTPNMSDAPYTNGAALGQAECSYLWDNYQNATPPIDPTFNLGSFKLVNTTNLADIKTLISQGNAVAYGTKLYTDFDSYRGKPVPYTGNGIIAKNKLGNVAGHCMLIIGYDDNCGDGALLIQNSWTNEWGSNGLVWMAYDTFLALVQGQGYYYAG